MYEYECRLYIEVIEYLAILLIIIIGKIMNHWKCIVTADNQARNHRARALPPMFVRSTKFFWIFQMTNVHHELIISS